MAEPTVKEIMAYLETPERPLPLAEFRAFWAGLSDAEKAEYKATIEESLK